MSADLSRVRFDPRRDHTGVIMQQGRLLLDADWNELVQILQRRLAAGTVDLAGEGPKPGIAGVAVVARTTPDAFKVTLSGGSLTIGRGRMYVDGILAENHGGEPLEFDPLLSELRGTTDIAYDAQPYWPEPTALPGGGTHLAYLDVWQRDVTHIEAPDLVEPAVGVDTTARTQTVWQVRLHRVDTGVTCGTKDADIQGWSEAIAPSGARLSVGTIEVDDDDDACALPPTGGFRGPEHQTYRIEVHDGGAPGAATFVWSRDSGSVVTPVLEVLAGGVGVRPASLGRDDVLGFGDDDWVEITDDHRELDRRPGELRRIEVDEAAGTVSFAGAPLPVDLRLTPAAASARHLRMRRWDQSGKVKDAGGAVLVDLDLPAATGAITVPASPATQVVLEDGLVVSFDTTGEAFRTGDHWIVPARAADAVGGIIDEPSLINAPPLGTHHHYARLGVLTFPDGETDCRTPWPDCECDGCSDCTICVTPESHGSGTLTIQAALDQVRELGGGTVCLAIGVYRLEDDGVLVQSGMSIRLRGQGVRTILLAAGNGIVVRSSAFIAIENLTVFASGAQPAVSLESTAATTVTRTTLLMLRSSDLPEPAIALRGVALATTIADNVVIGGAGISNGLVEPRPLMTGELGIRGNLLLCRDVGVSLAGPLAHLFDNDVEENTVLRCADVGVRVEGALAAAGSCTVAENTLVVDGAGIQVGTGGYEVRGNEITGTAQSLQARGDGIAVRPSLGDLRGPTRIAANRVRDVGGYGIRTLAPVGALDVAGNLVERAWHGIVMDGKSLAGIASITHNTVLDVGSRPTDEVVGVLGIRVTGARRATIESNTVHGVGTAREVGPQSVGIDVLASIESRVAGNSVDRIGFLESGGEEIGIAVRGRIRRCQIDGNSARRQPIEVDDDNPTAFYGLLVGADTMIQEASLVTVGDWVIGAGPVNFVIGPLIAYAAAPRVRMSVIIDANIISGSGKVPAVAVGVSGDVIVTANHVHQFLDGAAGLVIHAVSTTVGQNRLRGGQPAGFLDVDEDRIAVLGNLVTQPILVRGANLPPRWDDLNQLVS